MNRKRQNNQQVLALEPKDRGEAPARGDGETEPFMAKSATENSAFTEQLMEEVCDRENLERAWKRVKRNKGSPGVDGMTIDDAKAFLRQHWPNIRSQLLNGNYQPQPVKRVEIPKPDGGVRKLGVPCVVDRLIQQAVLQVLQERWDPTFSEHSFGFRPGRSAHQAVAQAQRYIADGYNVVVDLDLERFFDRVNHDILMSRVAARIPDKRVLKLIRAFLNAGVWEMVWSDRWTKGPRKAVRSRPSSVISCSTISTRNWLDVVTGSAVTRMTATSMFAASTPAKG